MIPVPLSVKEAKERAADYFGFAASTLIQLSTGNVTEIPNPNILDDDQIERYEELQFQLEKCDRRPDGELKSPHQIDGKLLKPPYAIRLAIALFGEDGYAEYKAGGGNVSQIAMEWTKMDREYQKRQGKKDPKFIEALADLSPDFSANT
jgi:hypothetical protein